MTTLELTTDQAAALSGIAAPTWATHVEAWQPGDSGPIRFVKGVTNSEIAPLAVIAVQVADGRLVEFGLDVSSIDGYPMDGADLEEVAVALGMFESIVRAAKITISLESAR